MHTALNADWLKCISLTVLVRYLIEATEPLRAHQSLTMFYSTVLSAFAASFCVILCDIFILCVKKKKVNGKKEPGLWSFLWKHVSTIC